MPDACPGDHTLPQLPDGLVAGHGSAARRRLSDSSSKKEQAEEYGKRQTKSGEKKEPSKEESSGGKKGGKDRDGGGEEASGSKDNGKQRGGGGGGDTKGRGRVPPRAQCQPSLYELAKEDPDLQTLVRWGQLDACAWYAGGC